MPAPILHMDSWRTVGHLVHTMATRGRLVKFSTDFLVYRSAIYPQGRTFKYGPGGRLGAGATSNVESCCVYIIACKRRQRMRVVTMARLLFFSYFFLCCLFVFYIALNAEQCENLGTWAKVFLLGGVLISEIFS